MRFLLLLLITFLLSCSKTKETKLLFDNLHNQEKVVIYLSKYHLDSVPREVGQLTTLKSLHIYTDSTQGWTIYPPLSALQQMTEIPPFRQLPDEITDLKNLHHLALVGLNLKQLPDNFGDLQKLDTLNLMMNKLTIAYEIEKLKKLKNLKYLQIFGNKVDTADIRVLKKENPGLVIYSGLE